MWIKLEDLPDGHANIISIINNCGPGGSAFVQCDTSLWERVLEVDRRLLELRKEAMQARITPYGFTLLQYGKVEV